MEDILNWFASNWAAAIGALGIIASLLFSAITTREDCRARQVANLLALDERHRALWREAEQRQDLKRILSGQVEDLSQPISPEEELFIRRIVLHFETGWRLVRLMHCTELDALAQDAADLFQCPLPRAVWERTKKYRNSKFVRFVEKAIRRNAS